MFVTNAHTEPSTSIQIQNYDGPIYLHAPVTCKEDQHKLLHISKDHCHQSSRCDADCSCVSRTSPKCVPLNTASESSCCSGYIAPYPYCPYQAQGDTQLYYTVESQRIPNCPKTLDCTSTKDRNQLCCKCACCY